MPRPVCVKCRREMRCEKSGAVSFFAKVTGYDRPYQQWQGDLYKCHHCGNEVITGYGGGATFLAHNPANHPEKPIAVSYEHVMAVTESPE